MSIVGCGSDEEPGPGRRYLAGGSESRSAPFPTAAYAAIRSDSSARAPTEGERLDAASEARVGAVLDAIAPQLEAWARREPARRVAQLTLTASEMTPRAQVGALHAAFARSGGKRRGEGRVGAADVCAATLAELPPEIQAEVRAQMKGPGERKRGQSSMTDFVSGAGAKRRLSFG